ncbi:MAG: holin family protein [Rickettsiales bacterium]
MSAWLALVPAVSDLLDKLIPDPEAREKAKLELLKAERETDLEELRLAISADAMQAEINKNEATHRTLFVAGWRPFIGWVCGVAFAYHFIIQPIAAFAIANQGSEVHLPDFDIEALFTVLMGMLGLGGLRTIEKIKNISK